MGDWQIDILDWLINAGTVGRDQSELLRRFQGRASSEMITSFLESYHLEQRLQKFVYPPKGGKGRRKTVWRATTKMVETDGGIQKEVDKEVDNATHPDSIKKGVVRAAVAKSNDGKRNKKR